MIWIIWSAVFIATALMAYGLETVWHRRQRVRVRAGDPGPLPDSPFLRQKSTSGWLDWLAFSGQWALPDMEKASELRKELIRAGFHSPQAPAIYLGLRVISGFVFTMPVTLFLMIKGVFHPFSILISFSLAIFGFFLPAKVLAVMIRHRQERLDRALPDILDMFVICMEAGLSLNATLHRVEEEIRGIFKDFSDELQIVAGELCTGIPWAEAFDNLGKRTDVQSIRSMVGLMIQSNKLGVSIGEALRHHGEFVRTQRVLRAEERAAKLPLKMIFPLIFCIFPAILIVVAGPGIIHVMEKFLKNGGISF